MKVTKIIQLINQHLADELLTAQDVLVHIDRTIDDINANLNTVFPAMSDFLEETPDSDPDYNFFPDKYIRSVLVLGASLKYFTTDEEGGIAPQQYSFDYRQNMFFMVRDYSFSIPTEYRADYQGFVKSEEDDARGLTTKRNPLG